MKIKKKYKYIIYLSGIIIGGIAGALYYKFVGCKTGACPLTSQIHRSIIAGSLWGGFATFIIFK